MPYEVSSKVDFSKEGNYKILHRCTTLESYQSLHFHCTINFCVPTLQFNQIWAEMFVKFIIFLHNKFNLDSFYEKGSVKECRRLTGQARRRNM